MDKKKYKPKAGLHNVVDEIKSVSSKESAEQYLSTHEVAKVFKEMKPVNPSEGIIPSVISTEDNKPNFEAIKNTVSETSWQDFEKIEFENAPAAQTYISEAEFLEREEQLRAAMAPPVQQPQESDMAVLNQAMPAASLPSAAEVQALDADALQKEITTASAKREEVAAELESLNDKLVQMKDDLSQAQKDFNTISKAKKIEDIQKYVEKKMEDHQSGQGEVFAMEQEGNEKKIARAKANMERAKAALDAAKELLANFDPAADNAATANMKYMALKQSTAELEAQIAAKKGEQKLLTDMAAIYEKQLKSLQ